MRVIETAEHHLNQAHAIIECKQAVFSSIAKGKVIAQCGRVRLDTNHAKIFESFDYKVDNHAKRYAGFREFSGKNIIDWSKHDKKINLVSRLVIQREKTEKILTVAIKR